MLRNQSYQAYQNNAVTTASGAQLTLMLYNGCVKFIQQGMKAMEEQQFEVKNKAIQRAQDIIQELMLTLNQEIEISKQMMPLYEYIHYQLQQGNMKNDITSLEEALELVMEFRDTWKDAMKQETTTVQQGARV
ncbi:MAG TPA: flagellar export chaperone FliS [Pseudogracilibacillus sp.]|nr:flagellar export chaperone FliS [Pseudogracilibacillus sp.]